jgi:SAM-dependent methyltransferase
MDKNYLELGEEYAALVSSKPLLLARPVDWRVDLAIGRQWELHAVLSSVEGHIRPTDTVLEYGAWPNLASVYIQTRVVPQGQVYAIDVMQVRTRSDREGLYERAPHPEEWIAELSSYNPAPLASEGDIQATVFKDGAFDCVMSFGVHEHITDDLKALKEIRRILRPGGILAMTVDFGWVGFDYDDALLGRCYDPARMDALVAASGLKWRDGAPAYVSPEYTWKNKLNDPHLCAQLIVLQKPLAEEHND